MIAFPHRASIALALIACAGMALSGCTSTTHSDAASTRPTGHPAESEAPHSADPTTTPVPVPTATPTPAPTAAAAPPLIWDPDDPERTYAIVVHHSADPKLLIQITTVVHANNGAARTMVETVHAPVTRTAHAKRDLALLDSQCAGREPWRPRFPKAQFITVTVDVTHVAGTPTWPAKAEPLGAYFARFDGWIGLEYPACETLTTVPVGSAYGVGAVPSPDPADGRLGWGNLYWGFYPSVQDDDGHQAHRIGFSPCVFTLGPLATKSKYAAKWISSATSTNYSCQMGGKGILSGQFD